MSETENESKRRNSMKLLRDRRIARHRKMLPNAQIENNGDQVKIIHPDDDLANRILQAASGPLLIYEPEDRVSKKRSQSLSFKNGLAEFKKLLIENGIDGEWVETRDYLPVRRTAHTGGDALTNSAPLLTFKSANNTERGPFTERRELFEFRGRDGAVMIWSPEKPTANLKFSGNGSKTLRRQIADALCRYCCGCVKCEDEKEIPD